MDASDFLDAGAASMWYTYRRGSGVFYKLGRTKVAPGKTALIAALLNELAANTEAAVTAQWPLLAQRSNAFFASSPSQGARSDAMRFALIANGTRTCYEVGVQSCRCQFIVRDELDDAIIWMARALGYDSLFLTATLLCNYQPQSSSGKGHNAGVRGFGAAYPEIVDVRPLDGGMGESQGRGEHAYLEDGGGAGGGSAIDVRMRRKRKDAAQSWVQSMQEGGRITLRGPPALLGTTKPPFDVPARPCNFSVARWTLQCEGHISSLPSAWNRCGVPTCDWVRAAAGSTSAPGASRSLVTDS